VAIERAGHISPIPYRNDEQAERLWEGLRKAGLPE
jgi:hypothetical protein